MVTGRNIPSKFTAGLLLAILLCTEAEAQRGRSLQSEEFLGTLYLNYLLSAERSETGWAILTEALRETVSNQPDYGKGKTALLFAEGQLARARRQYDTARKCFEKAKNLDEVEILPYLGLAETILDAEGPGAEAKQLLAKARILLTVSVPLHAQHLFLAKIGSLYRKAGDYSEALEIYKEIVARKPGWQYARETLEQVRLELEYGRH